jgi:glycosyltransferase involved in cell wall biosynthesis
MHSLAGDLRNGRTALGSDASPALTIGIDARAAAEVAGGRGRFVRELLRALAGRPDAHRYILYARRQWLDAELDERFSWRLVDAADPWWHLASARRANRECDVFLSTNSYLTLWFLRIPGVPVVYDMTTFERSMRPNRRSAVIERATLGHAVRRSSAILAISHATAARLAERFPRAAALTTVAPLGVTTLENDEPADAKNGAAQNLPKTGFVLAVGTLEPRKNLPRLVDAYARLPESLQAQHPLVVVGAHGWETGETLEALRSLGERSLLLGSVSDAALAELYRRCALFCYPSLGEGFGLPVLEAMASGAAVITSNNSSLPEVGGDAVEYVDPFDVASITATLRALLESPSRREALGELARERARPSTWRRTAEITVRALERAAGGG